MAYSHTHTHIYTKEPHKGCKEIKLLQTSSTTTTKADEWGEKGIDRKHVYSRRLVVMPRHSAANACFNSHIIIVTTNSTVYRSVDKKVPSIERTTRENEEEKEGEKKGLKELKKKSRSCI